jgi:anti-sigma factor RsiW
MPAGPEQRLNPDERANLVAYIDGELPDNESRVIATKLTQSATARQEVEALKRTWDLLECLPRPQASGEFPARTLTFLQASESGASLDEVAWAWLRLLGRVFVSLVVAGAALGSGFALTRWVWPDPYARMAKDLTLGEHLQEYEEVGSFDLLDELVRSKEFGRSSP